MEGKHCCKKSISDDLAVNPAQKVFKCRTCGDQLVIKGEGAVLEILPKDFFQRHNGKPFEYFCLT